MSDLGGHRTYTLDDPRPIAKEAPYTFFLPTQRALDRLDRSDLVKLIFRAADETVQPERMWVKIVQRTPTGLVGALDNVPEALPGLSLGDRVSFAPHHVITIYHENDARGAEGGHRTYWERCLVDDCILYDGKLVQLAYREEPDIGNDSDQYPDSGWRFRGDWRNVSDDDFDARTLSYVALGAVLNRDDSWLKLIDSPVGTSFERDFESERWVATP